MVRLILLCCLRGTQGRGNVRRRGRVSTGARAGCGAPCHLPPLPSAPAPRHGPPPLPFPRAAPPPPPRWYYPNTDAEKLDIKQLPCGAACTMAELEAGCLAEPTCVAFNTHGWLKVGWLKMACGAAHGWRAWVERFAALLPLAVNPARCVRPALGVGVGL